MLVVRPNDRTINNSNFIIHFLYKLDKKLNYDVISKKDSQNNFMIKNSLLCMLVNTLRQGPSIMFYEIFMFYFSLQKRNEYNVKSDS